MNTAQNPHFTVLIFHLLTHVDTWRQFKSRQFRFVLDISL